MNENNLYYKRGMHIIDKLLKNFNNDSTFYKNRLEFSKSELKRMFTNKDLVDKDINSFYITSLVVLLGLNKENIENLNKHNNYDLSECNKIREKTFIEKVKKEYPEFDKGRKIQTKFDNWLSVENCDHPTMCYMMNIRNGLLHGEYEPLGEFGDLLSIKNSNYTNFNSKVILLGILDFCELYFGNNAWTGISEKFNIEEIMCQEQINNDIDLDKALNSIKIHQITYNYKRDMKNVKIPELKIANILEKTERKTSDKTSIHDLLKQVFNKNWEYTVNTKTLSNDEKNIIIKMINKYYGESFYKLNKEDQNTQLALLTRYLVDSRSTLSEWVCDYIDLFNMIKYVSYYSYEKHQKQIDEIIDTLTGEVNKRSVFACKTSLLIIKLYHVLYRLQYKNYEEVDYSKIDFDTSSNDYNYERKDKDGSITYDFNIDKAKMKLNHQNDTDKEIENRVICEIIRDALCHGNINMNFKIENDELVECIVFEDIYKGRVRKLEITLDKLETFLKSDAFKVENCLVKNNTSKIK